MNAPRPDRSSQHLALLLLKKFDEAKRGELIEVPLDTLPLHHTVKAYAIKVK